MLKAQIKVGGIYIAKVSNKLVRVRVDRILNQTRWKSIAATSYACTNLATGREVRFRSAAKFREEVV